MLHHATACMTVIACHHTDKLTLSVAHHALHVMKFDVYVDYVSDGKTAKIETEAFGGLIVRVEGHEHIEVVPTVAVVVRKCTEP